MVEKQEVSYQVGKGMGRKKSHIRQKTENKAVPGIKQCKREMADKQNTMHAVTQVAIQAAIMAVKEAENPVNCERSIQVMPRTGSSALKQPIFDWKIAKKKCQKL